MNSYENKLPPPPPIIALIISFLWEFAVCVFRAVKTALVKQRSRGRTDGSGGREEGAPRPPHLRHFPVDFVEGSSAPWLNGQRHANEWRTNVIIYQTKSGGL